MAQTRSTEEMAARTPGAAGVAPTRLVASGALPAWDSFSLVERRLVVHLLVQAARRRVQNRPTALVGGPGR